MSINELKFETVDNSLRDSLPSTRTREPSELVKRLLNDETLFIPANGVNENALNKFYPRARKLGFAFNKRKTELNKVPGFMIWFSKQQETATNG